MKTDITPEAREKLLKDREQLVILVEELRVKPLSSKSAAAVRFREEDLTALAKKIVGIDKKLGRV